jgi:hypothetical protein
MKNYLAYMNQDYFIHTLYLKNYAINKDLLHKIPFSIYSSFIFY